MDAARALGQLLVQYGVEEESEEALRLQRYLALLEKWNAHVNLTASTAWSALGWLFEEALWAARCYPQTGVAHLDIGSGAGFPAVPLRILRPAMRLRLVESRNRRGAFLETVAAELGLDGTEVVCCRAEQYLRSEPAPEFDIVSWKAVKLGTTAMDLLLAASKPDTQIWLFHGAELPIENPARAQRRLRLLRREHFPGRPRRQLSVFAVSRETSFT